MKEDILIKARIVSKEWQIKHCEHLIKNLTDFAEDEAIKIGLLDDELSVDGIETHLYLKSLLSQIDEQNRFISVFKQDLQKLNNKADGYCYCEKCVANRARGNDEK